MTDQPPTGDQPEPQAPQPPTPEPQARPEVPPATPAFSAERTVPQWTSAEAAPAAPVYTPPAQVPAPEAAPTPAAAVPVAAAAAAPPPPPVPVAPPPAAAQPPATPAWQAPPPAPPRTPEVPGAPGRYFAITVTRVAALLVDSIIVGIVAAFIGAIIGGVVGAASPDSFLPDLNGVASSATRGVGIAAGLSAAVISYLYFVLLWRSGGKATVGQRVFKMQVGNAFDGATLTWQQASVRWLTLYGLTILAALPLVGGLAGLAALIWSIVLLATTATSATKQGIHDRWANSAVVATAQQNPTAAWGCLIAYVVGIILITIVALAAIVAIVATMFSISQ